MTPVIPVQCSPCPSTLVQTNVVRQCLFEINAVPMTYDLYMKTAVLNKAKLPTLYNQRLHNIATLMFKVKHGNCPTYISDLFNLQTIQIKPYELTGPAERIFKWGG